MSKRKFAGSALLDYILPTVLIGIVVGLGVFNTTNDGKLLQFIESSLPGGTYDGNGKLQFGIGIETSGSVANLIDMQAPLISEMNHRSPGSMEAIIPNIPQGHLNGVRASNGPVAAAAPRVNTIATLPPEINVSRSSPVRKLKSAAIPVKSISTSTPVKKVAAAAPAKRVAAAVQGSSNRKVSRSKKKKVSTGIKSPPTSGAIRVASTNLGVAGSGSSIGVGLITAF